ncbi:DUF1989 domain-containing protein [Bordetella bronchialis]|uniref:DUF1989 domain-containing protein n=1 Tax=Bordetella bronchialis TaxID=463025 RepID=UPI000A9B7F3C|nr:urea carboxylase-associated family protein [Bordetella bronchialis]
MDLTILPARTGTRVALRKGQALKVVNTHGGQVVDLWAYLPDGSEHMSMPHSVVTLGRIKPLPGDLLYTQLREPILRLEKDESPGTHCMLFAACDGARYRLLGAKGHHHNCADNMREALRPLGIDVGYVPTPLNLFMNTLFHEHREMEVAEPRAQAGDSVTFRAERDCIAVMSACPQDMVPVNAHGCTPQPVAYCVLD